MIIGIGGNRPGAGKDEVGKIIAETGSTRFAFGDPVKAEVSAITLGGSPIPHAVRNDPRLSELHEALIKCRGLDPFAKPTPFWMRRALQLWGTEYRREQDPDYWLKRSAVALDSFRGDAHFCDVRFPNEIAFVRRRGGVLWYIERRGDPGPRHASEQLTRDCADLIIVNGGDLRALRRAVLRAAAKARLSVPAPVGYAQ